MSMLTGIMSHPLPGSPGPNHNMQICGCIGGTDSELHETKPFHNRAMSLVVAGSAIGIGGLLCGYFVGLTGVML